MREPQPLLRVCTICARGGSKGVKNKNLRILAGKPMIAHTLEQARASGLFKVIAVSSDSSEILDVAKKYGADLCIERPAEMASDTAAKLPAITHAVQSIEKSLGEKFDICVDLDATSPLRAVEDIRAAVEMLETSSRFENIITGCRARRSPYFNLVELNSQGCVELSKKTQSPIVRRQDAPVAFDLNASIYVWKRDALFRDPRAIGEKTGLYEMPEERSIDIDSELDFEWVEFLMNRDRKSRT